MGWGGGGWQPSCSSFAGASRFGSSLYVLFMSVGFSTVYSHSPTARTLTRSKKKLRLNAVYVL